MKHPEHSAVEKITRWVGSPASLFVHTAIFLGALVVGFGHWASWDTVLLVLTTAVSLEAIYLAIFIQMTVNRHAMQLREVEEDIEEIGEDVEDIQEDIEEIGEDVEDIQEDVEDIQENVEVLEEDGEEVQSSPLADSRTASLDTLMEDVKRILSDLEALKSKN